MHTIATALAITVAWLIAGLFAALVVGKLFADPKGPGALTDVETHESGAGGGDPSIVVIHAEPDGSFRNQNNG